MTILSFRKHLSLLLASTLFHLVTAPSYGGGSEGSESPRPVTDKDEELLAKSPPAGGAQTTHSMDISDLEREVISTLQKGHVTSQRGSSGDRVKASSSLRPVSPASAPKTTHPRDVADLEREVHKILKAGFQETQQNARNSEALKNTAALGLAELSQAKRTAADPKASRERDSMASSRPSAAPVPRAVSRYRGPAHQAPAIEPDYSELPKPPNLLKDPSFQAFMEEMTSLRGAMSTTPSQFAKERKKRLEAYAEENGLDIEFLKVAAVSYTTSRSALQPRKTRSPVDPRLPHSGPQASQEQGSLQNVQYRARAEERRIAPEPLKRKARGETQGEESEPRDLGGEDALGKRKK